MEPAGSGWYYEINNPSLGLGLFLHINDLSISLSFRRLDQLYLLHCEVFVWLPGVFLPNLLTHDPDVRLLFSCLQVV